jgi:hypothetical protein
MRIFITRALTIMLGWICIVQIAKSQVVGTEAFLKGTFVEVGVSPCGVFGTVAPAPTGYHANAPGGALGFIADANKDGWTVGSPPFCGDYFVPGTPEEGFSIEIAGQNYGNFMNNCSSNQITGSITSYTNTGGVITLTWTGSVNGLNVVQVTKLNQNDLYFTTTVTLTNTTSAALNNVFYMRNVDPDNEEVATGSYTTQNTILYEPGTGCPRALVGATGPTTGCFLGLGTIDQRARVSYGGFLNRSASDIWNAIGVSQTGTSLADQAISLSFNLGNIAAGASTIISYAYILSANDLLNVLPAPALPPVTANGIDISTTNLYQGCTNDLVNVVISDGGNFTWTWAPSTDIATLNLKGNNATIKPTANRSYTVTGVNACGQQIMRNVNVQVSAKPIANAGVDRIICPGSTTNLGSTYTYPHTYSWTSVPAGFTSSIFNPAVTPTQTTTYTLTETNNGCSAVDQVTIEVLGTNLIAGPAVVCTGGSGYTYSVPVIAGATYNWWIQGSGNILTGQGTNQVTTSFPWFTGGSIFVGINVSGSYCQVSLPITVAPPTITVTPSSAPICAGYPVTLTASGAVSYTWSPATSLSATTGATVTANPTTTTTYTVTGIVAGCSTPGTATVTVSIKPVSDCCLPGLINKCTGNTYTHTTDFTMAGYPQGIAIDNSGNFFIANGYYNTVEKFSSTGTSLGIFASGFGLALGVASDANGNIFVADNANRRVVKYSPAGVALGTMVIYNSLGEALDPVFVTTDNCGYVYITGSVGNFISKFDTGCNFVTNIITSLPGETFTAHVRGVAVDKAGNIFVNDGSAGTIKKFDKSGTYLYSWACDYLDEMAVDAGGNVYATSGSEIKVYKYSNNGILLATLTMPAVSGWSFGVDVDANCNVWVGATNIGTISNFAYTSALPREAATGDVTQSQESAALAVKAYPNPSSGSVTLAFPAEGNYEVTVYNSIGVEVFRKKVTGDVLQLSGEYLAAGMYTVYTTGENLNSSVKIVIVK